MRLGALVLLLLVAACLALFAYTAARQRTRTLEAALDGAYTQARSFEEHLTQTLQLVELITAGLPPVAAGFEATAQAALRPAPYLRSLWLLDAAGQALASSTPGRAGQAFDLQDFYPAGEPAAEVLRLGRPQRGRDLGDAADAQAAAGAGLSVVPLLRRLPGPTPGAAPWGPWVMAAVNPDHFIHHFTQLLDPHAGHVQWLRYDGTLLASSRLQDTPGALGLAGEVPQRLTQREFGRFEQTLTGGVQVLTAYRASSRFPALVAVHVDREQVLAQWRDETRQTAVVVLPAVATLALAGMLIIRRQSQLDAQQAELRRQMQLSASVFEASSEAIVLTTPDGKIISCNAAFLRLTGRPIDQVLGRTHRVVASGVHDQDFYRRMWDHILRDDRWQGELTNRRSDGSLYTVLVSVNAVRDEHGHLQHYVGVARDITERKRAEAAERQAELQLQQQAAEKQMLHELAVRDALTGLFNRRYLDETLPRELARVKREGRALAVVMLDIDHFKAINDSHGHSAGDEVIRGLARVLSASAREGDVVCRYGGEEFVVVMPGMDAAAALARAERWRLQAAEQSVEHGAQVLRYTLSAGVAAYPGHGTDADALLRSADLGMYRAKRDGRDRVVGAAMLG